MRTDGTDSISLTNQLVQEEEEEEEEESSDKY
jgi:hypothetical protein